MSKFRLYSDSKGEWRWTYYAGNGEALATASEGYVSKQGAFSGIQLVKGCAEAIVESGPPLPVKPRIVAEEPVVEAKPKRVRKSRKK